MWRVWVYKMSLNPKLNKFSTASPIIASYDYTDLASGLGIQVFEGFATTIATPTIAYELAENPILSAPPNTGKVINNGSASEVYTFKTTAFNLAQTITGIGYTAFTHSCAASSQTGESTVTITLQHYDGGTTTITDIGEAVTTQKQAAANQSDYWNEYLPITITEKVFKVGDKLYIKVTHDMIASAVGNRTFNFYHDPLEALVGNTTVITSFKTQLPFKIDNI